MPLTRPVLILMALASFGSVGFALLAQYQWDMQPCPWCILQRLLFLLIGTVSALGAGWGGRLGMKFSCALIVPTALAGAAAAWYQHFVAAKTASCNLTLADRIVSSLHLDTALPSVFEVRASCADAAVDLIGVPFEFWGMALYLLIAAAALYCALRTHAHE